MVGGLKGGVVLDTEPGKPSEGLGYTHEEVKRNIKRKFGKQPPKEQPPVEEEIIEEGFEPDVEREIEKVDHRVGKLYTKEAYIQQLERYAASYPVSERKSESYIDIKRSLIEARELPDYVEIRRTEEGFSLTVDPVVKARMEWETASPFQQIAKAGWVGVTHWPSTLWESGTSLIGLGKPVQEYQKEIITWESMTWEQAQTIHKGGSPIPFLRSTVTSPAVIEAGTLGVIKGASILAKPITRWGVRTGIRTVSRISSFIPDEKLITESGRIVHSSIVKRLTAKIGETQVWRTASRWSTGDIVKIRSLPFYKTIHYSQDKVTSRLDIYQGWGKPKWVPKSVLKQAQKAETFHIHKIDPFGRYQAFVTEKAYKPTGGLWWKTAKRQITTFAEHEPIIAKGVPGMVDVKNPAFLWSGKVRPPGRATIFLKDINAYTTIPRQVHYKPMIRTGLHHVGSITTGSLAIQTPTISIVPLLGTGMLSQLDIKSELLYQPVMKTPQQYDTSRNITNISAVEPIQITQPLLIPATTIKKRTLQKTKTVYTSTTPTSVVPSHIPINVFMTGRSFRFKFPSGDGIVRQKKRYYPDIFGLGYKFRLFESKKYEYRSPFKI